MSAYLFGFFSIDAYNSTWPKGDYVLIDGRLTVNAKLDLREELS